MGYELVRVRLCKGIISLFYNLAGVEIGNNISPNPIGERTVARMMVPPNKSRVCSKAYRSIFDARVMPAVNKLNIDHVDDHFYTARANYVLEFAAMTDAGVLALDNKDKVKVGRTTLAVDRRTRNRRLFPQGDGPNYYDHDFPTPKYLLTPCGYLNLTTTKEMTTDELGRQHYV